MFVSTSVYLGFWILGFVSLVGAGILGAIWHDGSGLALAVHAAAAIGSAFFNLLLHTAAIFHTVGNGVQVKEASARLSVGPALIASFRRCHSLCHPIATVCCGLIVLATISGAACNFGLLTAGVHAALFYLNVVALLIALPLQYRAVRLSNELSRDADALVRRESCVGRQPEEGSA